MLGAVTFVQFNPDGLDSKYTVLPIQIFNLSSRRSPGSSRSAAAAIVLLLGIVLLMNSIAIIIRNRFQKRW